MHMMNSKTPPGLRARQSMRSTYVQGKVKVNA